ncbi:hypothetical protein EDB85DRAFT_1457280 [Lactarius pseudohatsudake]|nr:hypothetical protein EDB85DRAFT_1457280 [Lactarius pseudohatsudake]
MALSGSSITISKGHIHPVPQPPAYSRYNSSASSVMSYLSTPLPRDPVPWPLWSATPCRPLTHRHQSDDICSSCRLLYRWRHSYSRTLTLAHPSPVLVPCVPTLMCFHLCLAFSHPRYATAFSCLELSYLLNSNSSITHDLLPPATRLFAISKCRFFTLSLNTPKNTVFPFLLLLPLLLLFHQTRPKKSFSYPLHPPNPSTTLPSLPDSPQSQFYDTPICSFAGDILSHFVTDTYEFCTTVVLHTDEPRATLLQWITIMAHSL